MKMSEKVCQLCQREVNALTVHHLVPRQTTKRKKEKLSETINICSACHRQIHTLFNNSYLASHLNTLLKLQNEPQMQKFLAWIRQQAPQKRIKTHRPRAHS